MQGAPESYLAEYQAESLGGCRPVSPCRGCWYVKCPGRRRLPHLQTGPGGRVWHADDRRRFKVHSHNARQAVSKGLRLQMLTGVTRRQHRV